VRTWMRGGVAAVCWIMPIPAQNEKNVKAANVPGQHFRTIFPDWTPEPDSQT